MDVSSALLAGLMMFAAGAQLGTQPLLPQAQSLSFRELDRAEATARYGHPNEMWRYRALRALKLQQPTRAADYFRQAGRYGDKFSQHALSLMYWHGVGVARDVAQAYVWGDLAAERGYRDLLLVREKMWMSMETRQRRHALSIGPRMYAEYGDAAAKPRMEWELRKALANATGSRVGAQKDRVRFLNLGAIADLDVSGFYERERWNATAYWREQDRQWDAKVIVLPLEQLPDPPPSP